MDQQHENLYVVTSLSFEAAISAVSAALKHAGLDLLAMIDVQATLRQELGLQRPPYTILGAGIPQVAQPALGAEPAIGLVPPCNVVVYVDAQGRTVVSAINPQALFADMQRDDLAPLAAEVGDRLRHALETLPMLVATDQ